MDPNPYRWARTEPVTPQPTDLIHVHPLFGPEHELSLACWCHPDLDEENPNVCIHNVAN